MNIRIIWVAIGMMCLSGSSDLGAARFSQDPFAVCGTLNGDDGLDDEQRAELERMKENSMEMRRQAAADSRLKEERSALDKKYKKKRLAEEQRKLKQKQQDRQAKCKEEKATEARLPLYAKELASQKVEKIVAAVCGLSVRNQVALWGFLCAECPDRTFEMKIAFCSRSIFRSLYVEILKEEFEDVDKLIALVSVYPWHGLLPSTVARELFNAPDMKREKAFRSIVLDRVNFSDTYKRAVSDAMKRKGYLFLGLPEPMKWHEKFLDVGVNEY